MYHPIRAMRQNQEDIVVMLVTMSDRTPEHGGELPLCRRATEFFVDAIGRYSAHVHDLEALAR